MKVVILAGGFGTRLSEETHLRPKPMVEIGGQPILWHIMNIYAAHSLTDFVVCLGYKGYIIKEYFSNHVLHRADVTVDTQKREITYHRDWADPWRVTLVDTGIDTQTGGRLKRAARYLDQGEDFCVPYGDGVSDVDITALIAHHRAADAMATVTAVRPPGRYGATRIEGGRVVEFTEKPDGQGGYISGGFFVLGPRVLDLIEGDHTAWEIEPLQALARTGQLTAYQHEGFWHAIDTLRDKNHLEELWQSGRAPWKTWS